jgi:putative flippase GtrA
VTRRLRHFALVALLVTAVDITLLLLFGAGLDVPWPLADAASVAVAAVVSFLVHRAVTVPTGLFATIEHRPAQFAAATGPAALLDVAVFTLAWAIWEPWSASGALLAKVVALVVAGSLRIVTYRRLLWQTVRDVQAAPSHPPRDADVATGTGAPRVSVVLPAYRAEGVVAGSVAAVAAALAGYGPGAVEIVVVDDGSPDATTDRARAAGAHQVVRFPHNRGKGAAVRAGMLAATGDTVVFTDVDLAYEPSQIMGIVASVEAGYDVAVGSRRHPDTRTVAATGRVREFGSAVFNLMTYLTLLGAYRDTQSGLKGFRRDAARSIFGRTLVDGFAFDVEVLHLVERDGLSLTEVPVTVEYGTESTVRLAAEAVRMMRDVLRVRRWSAQGRYDLPGGHRDDSVASAPR